MANPDIPAALVVLATHLTAAGAALTDDILDVDRGFLTGSRQIRYWWAGEVSPPHMGGEAVLTGEMVGVRFQVGASWPLPSLGEDVVTALDVEMQTFATEVRTRILGDSTLGGNVTDLDLDYATPDTVLLANARFISLVWNLDLAYLEYTKAP